ncbi:hypothetical protein Scep_011920 [Stephania cephalantha]|uniref:Myb-like domain-containing protein n=1 Tax=Stephania cephalantha TaxID=152367 RepID=A0AAP0JGA9_9MAGN
MEQEGVSCRLTRSRASPDWTIQEMRVLVGEISAIESEFMKALSSFQKWKIIAGNCSALGVVRSLNQCRDKWNAMLAEYKVIKEWEMSQSEIDAYWSLEHGKKLECGLPPFFDRELFRLIAQHVRAQEDLSTTDTNSDSDLNSLGDSGTRKKRRVESSNQRGVTTEGVKSYRKKTEGVQEMAMKLQENVNLIHSIIRGDITKGKDSVIDRRGWTQTQFRRRQGVELIKVLENLVGGLDQLLVLIKETK